MAFDATFVQGNTGPDITAILHAEGDVEEPVDLTSATVRFQMRKNDDQIFTVDQPADVIGSPLDGFVSYSWATTDLSVPGPYDVQWQVTFPDGKIQTTAVANKIMVRRK